MAIPIPTQILDEIGARLTNISTANGYFHDIKKIERARLEPFRNIDMPSIVYYYTQDVVSTEVYNSTDERVLTVIIEIDESTRDQNYIDVGSKLASDIAVALKRATTAPLVADMPSKLLGGLLSRYQVNSITPIFGSNDAPFCGAILSLSAFYFVDDKAPFTITN